MNEGDCVKVIDGRDSGRTGYISMIDGDMCHVVMLDDGQPDMYRKGNLEVIECPEE